MSISRRTWLARAIAGVGALAAADVLGAPPDDSGQPSSPALPPLPPLPPSPGKRGPRVLLRSSWQTVNIGDVAHTPGMVRLLGRYLPDAQITLWPASVGERERHMLRQNFPNLLLAETPDAVAEAFEHCDFFLHGSGPSLVAQKQLAQWKQKTTKPFGVMGITLGALNDEARSLLDAARFVYFRDTLSLKFARDNHLNCPLMEFGPDAAFGVDLRDDARALPFLKEHGLEPGKFICAIARLRNTPYWLIRNKPMSDVDRAKDATNRQMKEHDHGMVREALVAFARETKLKVLVCPEDQSQMAVGKEQFIDPLPGDVKEQFVWRENFWLTDEAVSVYARALALLSMDMHSPIMAVANGTPAIHCRFKQQTSKGQMWRDIGLGDWLFDLDEEKNGANITRAILAIAHDPPAARQQVAKAMEFVTGRQRDMMAILGKALPHSV